jgi:PAS domain S-box-containing protein
MTAGKLTYEEMEAKLGEAQDILGALQRHDAAAIVGDRDLALRHLHEVEEALHQARAELEERVVERTAGLAKVNRQLQETLQSQREIQRRLECSTRQLHERAEQEMAEVCRFAESIVDMMAECLVVLDSQLRIISANRSFHETFGTDPQQIVGRPLPTLGGGLWSDAELCRRLHGVLTLGGSFRGWEIECSGGEPKAYVLSARPIGRPANDAERILLVLQDVTLRKGQQRVIEADKQQLDSLAEELMMIEERQRRQIAQALHDSVGQSLAFSKRELNLLRQHGPEEVRGILQEVCEQLDDAIKHTRDLTFELSPSTLYTLGLPAALEELAEQFAQSEGFHCHVESPGDYLPLNEQVRSLLYRAVRELLVNVAKHAEASNVRIILDRDEQGFRIAVQDDGKGFDVSVLQGRSKGGGFGILSVRERLVRIGGVFAVESAQGKGTTVTMIVPVNRGQRSDWGFDGVST